MTVNRNASILLCILFIVLMGTTMMMCRSIQDNSAQPANTIEAHSEDGIRVVYWDNFAHRFKKGDKTLTDDVVVIIDSVYYTERLY